MPDHMIPILGFGIRPKLDTISDPRIESPHWISVSDFRIRFPYPIFHRALPCANLDRPFRAMHDGTVPACRAGLG